MSGRGKIAFDEYCSVIVESGSFLSPRWDKLSHFERMAWEAAAIAVAKTVTFSEVTCWSESQKMSEIGEQRRIDRRKIED